VLAAPTDVGEATVDAWIECLAFYRKVSPESLAGYRSVLEGFLDTLDAEARLAWAQRQVYIALGQLMTTAAVLGIDACPMEGFSPAEYDKVLDLPGRNLTATVACALGYRADDDKHAAAPKARYPRDEVIETIA
jgi:nitroreductase